MVDGEDENSREEERRISREKKKAAEMKEEDYEGGSKGEGKAVRPRRIRGTSKRSSWICSGKYL